MATLSITRNVNMINKSTGRYELMPYVIMVTKETINECLDEIERIINRSRYTNDTFDYSDEIRQQMLKRQNERSEYNNIRLFYGNGTVD